MDWKSNGEAVKWLLKISKRYKRYIFGFLVINLITMLISLAGSIAGRYVVDAATGFHSELFMDCIVIMLAATVVSILISAAAGMFSGYVNEKFAFGVRVQIFDRVQRSSWFRLTQYHSGDLLARLTADVDEVASSLISMVPSVIVTVVQLILILVILFRYDPTLAVIGLVVGPLGALTAVAMKKKYSFYQEKLRESRSEYYGFLQETLSNISVAKAFQLEAENRRRLGQIRDARMKLVMKNTMLNSVMSSGMRLIYGIGYVAAFSWCAYRLTTAAVVTDPSGVEAATYTYGTMTLFLSLVSQVQGAIRSLGGVIPRFYSLMVSAKRLREITELEEEDDTRIDTMPQMVGLRVDGLSAAYDGEKGSVLNGLSFEIPAGSRVGIVGTSGAGKTTFVRLLLALLKPEEGTLAYIDEQGREEAACPASRRFISYVPQGNTLLSGSVRANLRAGKPDATEEEMWQALEMADAAGFLRRNPMGLDTVLAESAGGLSEGQAQRVAIARALLRGKPVLILDEATSALDEATEARVFRRITAQRSRTCFIITHRPSMLQYCDMVLRIHDDGRATIVGKPGPEEAK